MKWIEADPLPAVCQTCGGVDCYHCDHAGQRWYLPQKEELQLRRKGVLHGIARLQRQLESIDRELALLEEI